MKDEVTQQSKEFMLAPANTLVPVPPNPSWSPSHRHCIFGASTAHGFDGLRSQLKLPEGGFGRPQPRAAEKCENGCHVLRVFDRRNRSPGSGELRCFLSIPGNNSVIWWDKTWCFKFLQFNLESENQRAFSEHQRNIVSFINFKPTIL